MGLSSWDFSKELRFCGLKRTKAIPLGMPAWSWLIARKHGQQAWLLVKDGVFYQIIFSTVWCPASTYVLSTFSQLKCHHFLFNFQSCFIYASKQAYWWLATLPGTSPYSVSQDSHVSTHRGHLCSRSPQKSNQKRSKWCAHCWLEAWTMIFLVIKAEIWYTKNDDSHRHKSLSRGHTEILDLPAAWVQMGHLDSRPLTLNIWEMMVIMTVVTLRGLQDGINPIIVNSLPIEASQYASPSPNCGKSQILYPFSSLSIL